MVDPSYYFVLNGLQDGEGGVYAFTTDGTRQKDGWYYIYDIATHDGFCDNGIGPFISKDDAVAAAEAARPKLPSQWAKLGYYCIEHWRPKPGCDLDYYDRDGIKRRGTVVSCDDHEIVIDGYRRTVVRESFKLRHGRD